MTSEKKLIPKKRFKGFEDEWKEKKLGDYSIIKGRLGWKSLKQEEYTKSGPAMIAGRHIENGIINWKEVDHIPLWRYEESPEIMLKNGDVIFSKDGSLGNPAIIKKLENQATINATMMMVRLNDKIDSFYFYQILNSRFFLKLINLKVSGSSIPHLFQEDMKQFYFNGPSISEQQKIGEFFKVLDDRIANQERKIAKIKALKSAYLTEMFPQEGETTPKRRFSGYEDEWLKIKIEDIAEVSTGFAFSSSNFNKNGKYSVVTNKNIQDQTNGSKFSGDSINIKDVNLIEKYKLDGENVLVTMDGVNIGITGKYSDDSAVLAQRVGRLKSNVIDFIYQITKKDTFMLKMDSVSVGNAIKHISLSQIAEYRFYAPKSSDEQRKIGAFFKNLDDQIATEEAKLVKLKSTKTAYLEEMFV